MRLLSPEIDRLSPNVTIWHRYDTEAKAELYSTLFTTKNGTLMIDPIRDLPPSLGSAIEACTPAAIVVTNSNHHRAAASYSEEFALPIYAALEAEVPSARVFDGGEKVLSNVTVVSLEGAAPGEIALFHPDENGSVILGDALINFGSLGFSILPAKYCSNQKLLRKSLRKLLDFSFERMLFAHGSPIVAHARTRLATLLETLA